MPPSLFTQVTAPPPQVTKPALLTLPGDYVYVKVHKRNSLEPRWTGPYKVLLATPFSVSLLGKYGAEWHHLTHTRKAENHTSRTYDQVHADLLDIEHEEPTEQPAVPAAQQESPSRPVSVCGSPVECVGRPADPVRQGSAIKFGRGPIFFQTMASRAILFWGGGGGGGRSGRPI